MRKLYDIFTCGNEQFMYTRYEIMCSKIENYIDSFIDDFEEKYNILCKYLKHLQILTVYPFTIRCKDKHYGVKECIGKNCYVSNALNLKKHKKHILLAKQFIPNPDNLTEIDHIIHNRTDYHLLTLRLVSK